MEQSLTQPYLISHSQTAVTNAVQKCLQGRAPQPYTKGDSQLMSHKFKRGASPLMTRAIEVKLKGMTANSPKGKSQARSATGDTNWHARKACWSPDTLQPAKADTNMPSNRRVPANKGSDQV